MPSPLVIPDDLEFWEKVEMGSLYECWPYEGVRKDPSERSRPPQIKTGRGNKYIARRVAYKYANGIYGPSGMQFIDVMNTCGNNQCCNPNHLEASEPEVARLSEEEIEEIRESDAKRSEIMEEYGIEKPRFVDYIWKSE